MFDVAAPELLDLLQELKEKQVTVSTSKPTRSSSSSPVVVWSVQNYIFVGLYFRIILIVLGGERVRCTSSVLDMKCSETVPCGVSHKTVALSGLV